MTDEEVLAAGFKVVDRIKVPSAEDEKLIEQTIASVGLLHPSIEKNELLSKLYIRRMIANERRLYGPVPVGEKAS